MKIEDVKVGMRVRRDGIDRNLAEPKEVLEVIPVFGKIFTRSIPTGDFELLDPSGLVPD